MEIKIDIINGWRLPKGITSEAARKGLLWIETAKRARASREFPEGRITAEEIIAEATREGSDVWPLFCHDDDVIRRGYYHDQANYVSGCYKATVVYDDSSTVIHNPANVIIRPPDGGRYFASPMSVTDEDTQEQVIGEVINLLNGAQNRLTRIRSTFKQADRHIETLNRLIDDMEKAAKKAPAKSSRKRRKAAIA